MTIQESKSSELKPPVNKLPTGNLAPSNKQPAALVKNVSKNVAQVFGSDSDDEVGEEMPMEAKMKMR